MVLDSRVATPNFNLICLPTLRSKKFSVYDDCLVVQKLFNFYCCCCQCAIVLSCCYWVLTSRLLLASIFLTNNNNNSICKKPFVILLRSISFIWRLNMPWRQIDINSDVWARTVTSLEFIALWCLLPLLMKLGEPFKAAFYFTFIRQVG